MVLRAIYFFIQLGYDSFLYWRKEMRFLVSRELHDRLLEENPEFLQSLFARYTKQWSFYGVTFFFLRSADMATLRSYL